MNFNLYVELLVSTITSRIVQHNKMYKPNATAAEITIKKLKVGSLIAISYKKILLTAEQHCQFLYVSREIRITQRVYGI